jgi:RHS repeat-associated protein
MVGSTGYYMHPDALGSTRVVLTATFTIKFSSDYKPYGVGYSITGSETFKYTGKMSDSVTGLYYYGARFYDPTIGRFITQDSYSGKQVDPQSMDRYAYARDNPERFVDPSGHFIAETGAERQMETDVIAAGDVVLFTSAASTGYSDDRKVSYSASPTVVTIGAVAISGDVMLGREGVNQYSTETITLAGGGGPIDESLTIKTYKYDPTAAEGLLGSGLFLYFLGAFKVGATVYGAEGPSTVAGADSEGNPLLGPNLRYDPTGSSQDVSGGLVSGFTGLVLVFEGSYELGYDFGQGWRP